MVAVARVADRLQLQTLDAAELETLGPEWTALWALQPDPSPFVHPAWTRAWARTHAPGRARAVAVRRDGELVGLAPFFDWDGAVLLAGTGPSDHGDALVAPGAAEATDVLLAGLADAAAGGGLRIDLQQLRPTSPLLTACTPPGWRSQTLDGDVTPVAPLQGPEGTGAMPAKWRRKLGYTRRRAEDHGGWTTRRAADAAAVERGLTALERLHAARWESRGETGVLADDLSTALLREAAPALHDAGLLRLYVVLHKGRTAAAVLAARAGRTLCFYLSGMDPDAAELGAGTLLIGDILADAVREGCTAADFLRGRERYKYHWGAVDRPMFRRVLTRL